MRERPFGGRFIPSPRWKTRFQRKVSEFLIRGIRFFTFQYFISEWISQIKDDCFTVKRVENSDTRFPVLFEGNKRDNQKKNQKRNFGSFELEVFFYRVFLFFPEGSFAPVLGMMTFALMTISVMMRLFNKPAKIIRIITEIRT